MSSSPHRHSQHFACRPMLREALAGDGPLPPDVQAHVDGCAFCAARVQARTRLLPLLRRRPEAADVPPQQVLDGVYERVVERAERGPVGRLLDEHLPVPAERAADAWPDALLDSPVAMRVAGTLPTPPREWARVRESILGQLADQAAPATLEPVPAVRRARVWIGLVGSAVAATVVLAVLAREPHEPPVITFQDIARLPVDGAIPAVDFAVVRYGATR